MLRTVDDLPNVVHVIYRWVRQGQRILAVTSAIGDATDQLIRDSQALSPRPEPFATAELLATGERTSATLLGIALDRAGIAARVVSPREIAFEVSGTPLDGEPAGLGVERIRELLREVAVLVVPGFFGTDPSGRTHCLGRGGSDLTAAFLAVSLSARCRLLKDVDGVYESDPADANAHPCRFESLTYEEALKVARQLIQPKAVTHFEKHKASCEVAALTQSHATTVHARDTSVAAPWPKERLDVVLLGCGTVGFGVYQRLAANPEAFCVRGVLVRDRTRHERAGIPPDLLHTRLDTLRGPKPQLVIEALPGHSPAFELVVHYLSEGVDVVTANKAILAEDGAELTRLAGISGAQLRYSAAVGGAAPMLETCVQHAGKIQSLSAVVNGTCNFVLEACAAGASLKEALAAAQRLGLAETDASEDLSGRDAARKLQILARHAFGVEVPLTFYGLDETIVGRARAVAVLGERLRQVARGTPGGSGGRLRDFRARHSRLAIF